VSDVTGKARRNRVICKTARIPQGWVIVGQCHSAACGDDDDNAWVIKKPGSRDVVWRGSPIPEGYRAVKDTTSAACPGTGDNAVLIEREQ